MAEARRFANDLGVELADALEAYGDEIAKKAVGLARHAGRKTVKAADVKLAIK